MRLEEQGGGLLITLLMSLDVRTRTETRRAYVDVDDALAQVRAFFDAFRAERSADTTE